MSLDPHSCPHIERSSNLEPAARGVPARDVHPIAAVEVSRPILTGAEMVRNFVEPRRNRRLTDGGVEAGALQGEADPGPGDNDRSYGQRDLQVRSPILGKNRRTRGTATQRTKRPTILEMERSRPDLERTTVSQPARDLFESPTPGERGCRRLVHQESRHMRSRSGRNRDLS